MKKSIMPFVASEHRFESPLCKWNENQLDLAFVSLVFVSRPAKKNHSSLSPSLSFVSCVRPLAAASPVREKKTINLAMKHDARRVMMAFSIRGLSFLFFLSWMKSLKGLECRVDCQSEGRKSSIVFDAMLFECIERLFQSTTQ